METDSAKTAWLEEIDEHVYASADSYLRLLYPDEKAKEMVERLRTVSTTRFMAKDVFRALAPVAGESRDYLTGALAGLKAARPDLDTSRVDNFTRLLCLE